MNEPEIRTELSLIRKDVDDIKLLIPEIRNALQQLAVTNAQLVANMDEHKILWKKIDGLQHTYDTRVVPHLTTWDMHIAERGKMDSTLGKLKEEHLICMAEREAEKDEDARGTIWDKVLPQVVSSAINAVGTGIVLLFLLHAADLLK